MRNAFIKTLVEQAKKDPRIYLLVGDLGFSVVEPFAKKFPDRFFNLGVAEQNLIGVATGLALEGKIVFVYSIGNFISLRCLEQIRNDVCYHQANVKIVSVGAGLTYGNQGMTHQATEDIAILRALPKMRVISPADANQTKAVVKEIIRQPGPFYLRLVKSKEKTVFKKNLDFKIGRATVLKQGQEIAILSFGSMVDKALQVAKAINKDQSLRIKVVEMATIKPIDTVFLKHLAKEVKLIVTLEEHNLTGGFGSGIAEAMADHHLKVNLLRLGLNDNVWENHGDQDHLCRLQNLNQSSIKKRILKQFNIIKQNEKEKKKKSS